MSEENLTTSTTEAEVKIETVAPVSDIFAGLTISTPSKDSKVEEEEKKESHTSEGEDKDEVTLNCEDNRTTTNTKIFNYFRTEK